MTYEDWLSTNEGFLNTFYNIALGLSMVCLMSCRTTKIDKNNMKTMVNYVKTGKANPSDKYMGLMNDVKKRVIGNIDKSNKYNSYKKNEVIDSLKTIRFYVIADDVFPYNSTVGCYIHLDKNSNLLNYIILNEKYLSYDIEKLSKILTHEVYHYVDQLMGINDVYWSQLNSISKLLVKNVNDLDKFNDRAKQFISNDVDYSNKLSEFKKSFFDKRAYYTDETELFARYQGLKHWLVDHNMLKSMDDNINEEHYSYFLKDGVFDEISKEDFAPLLLFIDYNKIKSGKFNSLL